MRRRFLRKPLLLLLFLPLLPLAMLLGSCSSGSGDGSKADGDAPAPSGGGLRIGSGFSRSLTGAPQIINVSNYDPKERQRRGSSYSDTDVSALKRNGALGLIARCGKGRTTDFRCANFLRAAEREGMLLGAYYFILDGVDPVWQANRFVERMREIKSSMGLRTTGILMVVDFDSATTVPEMIRVIDRIERRTGNVPVVYMENSLAIMARTRAASASQKRRLKECPFWMALYSHTHEGRETPAGLLSYYGVWTHCIMWQYGGVKWEGGRSIAQHYNHGRWRSPQYFGNLDRPTERNAFNGSTQQLHGFWNRYAWQW